jgi:hypothetical protein
LLRKMLKFISSFTLDWYRQNYICPLFFRINLQYKISSKFMCSVCYIV